MLGWQELLLQSSVWRPLLGRIPKRKFVHRSLQIRTNTLSPITMDSTERQGLVINGFLALNPVTTTRQVTREFATRVDHTDLTGLNVTTVASQDIIRANVRNRDTRSQTIRVLQIGDKLTLSLGLNPAHLALKSL